MSYEDNNRKNEENDNNRRVPLAELMDKSMDIIPDKIDSVVDENSEHHDGQVGPSTSSSEMPVPVTLILPSDVCHVMSYKHLKTCAYPKKCTKYCSRMLKYQQCSGANSATDVPNTSTTNNTAMTSMDEAQQTSGESTVVQRPSTLLPSEPHSSGTASGGSATVAAQTRRNICKENESEMCGNAGPRCDGEATPSADLDGKVLVVVPKNRSSSSSSSC